LQEKKTRTCILLNCSNIYGINNSEKTRTRES
jgi:hypothetical protein